MTHVEIWDHEQFDGNEGLLAVVVHSGGVPQFGNTFVTSKDDPHQAAIARWERGHVVKPHRHLVQPDRKAPLTQEVLVLHRGRLLCDLYNSRGIHVRQWLLLPGSAIILLRGGHGFRAEEECELLYIKTGPYSGKAVDKVYFGPDDGN